MPTPHTDDSNTPHRFRTLSAFLMAVRNAASGAVPESLKSYAVAGSDEHGGYDSSRGGFLLPTELAREVLTTPVVDPLDRYITFVLMPHYDVAFPARTDKNHATSVSGGLTATRRPETVSGTSSRVEMELIELHAHDLLTIAYASNRAVNDSGGVIVQLLGVAAQDTITQKLMNERVRGSGAGEYLGILASPCLIEVTAASSPAVTPLEAQDVINMAGRVWEYDSRCTWLAHPDLLGHLSGLLHPVSNEPLFIYRRTEGERCMLHGRPVIFDPSCSPPGERGDLIAGCWSEFVEGRVGEGIALTRSVHVRFVEHEETFRFYLASDAQPWWRTALTPENHSALSPATTIATRSPFVALATRL